MKKKGMLLRVKKIFQKLGRNKQSEMNAVSDIFFMFQISLPSFGNGVRI